MYSCCDGADGRERVRGPMGMGRTGGDERRCLGCVGFFFGFGNLCVGFFEWGGLVDGMGLWFGLVW